MFERITPEEAGVSSKHVAEYISYLNRRGAVMHSVLMMRRGKIFAEYYWAPFHKDFVHRMYSETKSYVSIAIGLLIGEGKLKLTDKVYDYFKDRAPETVAPYLREQTLRDMLMMCTACSGKNWFTAGDPDRTHLYFSCNQKPYPAGTYWEYDSAGSQVMSSLVEQITGMKLLDYLKLKLFNRMGTFKDALILEAPNGDSWGDSALCCTSRDMASCAYLVSHYGEFEGEQLMSADYLREATSKQSGNPQGAFYDPFYTHGYGYQIWRVEQNGFMFNGMGSQYTIALPDRDFVFVCTGDNQGFVGAGHVIGNGMFDYIVNHMSDEPLPADPDAEAALAAETSDLKLAVAIGDPHSDLESELNGVTWICPKNDTGITKFRFDFDGDGGVFTYVNAQGEKKLRFGLGTNEFQKFPQLGYSNDHGAVRTTDGFMYDCAVSAAWRDPRKLQLRVQIIDRYFGNFHANFAWNGDLVHVRMAKTAEDFLNEYQGTFTATKE